MAKVVPDENGENRKLQRKAIRKVPVAAFVAGIDPTRFGLRATYPVIQG